jgi:uncharacterized protein YkwD
MPKKHKPNIFRWLKLAVVPHVDNDYRPHLVRRYGLVAILFFTIVLQYGAAYAQTSAIQNNGTDISSYNLLKKTNLVRENKSLAVLTENEKLTRAAQLKLDDMFAHQYWDHTSPSGIAPWKWLNDVGYQYYAAGENLARDFASTDAVISAWLDSTEHRKNVLSDVYTDVGFAVGEGVLDGQTTLLIVAFYGANGDGQNVVTQIASDGNVSFWTKIQLAIQSFEPFSSIGLGIVVLGIFVSILAHFNRHKLPKKLKHSLYRHHGVVKASGLAAYGAMMIMSLGVGQI